MAAARFWIVSFVVALAFLLLTRGLIGNEYYFFAAYQVLQFIVLATAWNILGGYTGYTEFVPSFEVKETKDALIIVADVPGVI